MDRRKGLCLVIIAAALVVGFGVAWNAQPGQPATQGQTQSLWSGHEAWRENELRRSAMQAIFEMLVAEQNKNGGYTEGIRLTVDLPFAPSVGMKVAARGCGDRTVQHVTLGLDADDQKPYLLVYLGEHVAPTQEKAEQLVQVYLMHDWKLAGLEK